MRTEYFVGNIRMHFELRARRRWFVRLVYAVLAVLSLAWCSFNPKQMIGAWIIGGCMILGVALLFVFSSISDVRAPDEREIYRRAEAYSKVYSLLGKSAVAALFISSYFRDSPVAPLEPVALRGGMVQSPYVLLMVTGILYITLPQAILMWTEPDMEENER